MAIRFVHRWSGMRRLAATCLLLLVSWRMCAAARHGLDAGTLHFPVLPDDVFGKNVRVVEQRWERSDSGDEVDISLSRARRDASPDGGLGNNITTIAMLNDSHHLMVIHWAGEGSHVIMALTRAGKLETQHSSSNVFVSYNYGKTFVSVRNKMKINSTTNSIIHHFYNHPRLNSHYVFTDIFNNYIFITRNYGRSFVKHSVPFTPKFISFHRLDPNIILGMDDDPIRKKLYLTTNFGDTWSLIQENVKAFFWGVVPFDDVKDIFVERLEPDGTSTVVKSNDYFHSNPKIVITNVEDFEVRDDYMFATIKTRSTHSSPYTLQLWISHERNEFLQGMFSVDLDHLDYFIADASEGQVFVCVNHNHVSNLYVSDVRGTKFLLSMKRIVYFNPKGANKDTWLRFYSEEAFADIHKVKGMRGVYIASQLLNETLSVENQISLITFNKGGQWSPLIAPNTDSKGSRTNCSRWQGCSLHLSQELLHLYPSSRTIVIMSRESAPGLIIASGTLGKNIKQKHQNVFLSADAGLTWNEILKESNFYTFGDHGGLIVAIEQTGLTDSLKYSWNEGETWTQYQFSKQKIMVYGLLTEPGEITTVFSVFGSYVDHHHWLIIQVNLSSVFPSSCSKDDYKKWSLSDSLLETKNFRSCLLGRKVVFDKRVPHAKCYNGRNFVRQTDVHNCSCHRADFECDYGFKLHAVTMQCLPDHSVNTDVYKIPSPCPPGTYYPFTKGFRRIPGDSCHGGEEMLYEPTMNSCPMPETVEFLLYARRKEIHRLILGDNRDDILVDRGLINTIALDFDKRNNCLYWADITTRNIKQLCLDGNHSIEIIIQENVTVIESLAYDWTSGNLYWLDAGRRILEVAKKNGRFRRILLRDKYLDRPRALTLDAHYGYLYWTDWSSSNPRIVKATMDCSNVTYIVQGLVNLKWPNGIAIDHQLDRIYWTDAGLHQIMSANLNGGDRKMILSGNRIQHPYAITIYKRNIYWTDWALHAILTADKINGYSLTMVKSGLSGLSDIKAIHHMSQQSSSACSIRNGLCTQLCIPVPHQFDVGGQNRKCLCADQIPHSRSSSGDETCTCWHGEIFKDGECIAAANSSCQPHQFTCHSRQCIPSNWRCDHDPDCFDGSDELNCVYRPCEQGSFRCNNTRCIPHHWRCDHDNDCGDNSDEHACNYPACQAGLFACKNMRCIPQNWTCDFDNDCHDGSDERNCSYGPVTCHSYQFDCGTQPSKCIPLGWKCDGTPDCSNGTDEQNCTVKCPSWKFKCKNAKCVYKNWVCDGDNDCGDNSDENTNCSLTTAMPRSTGSHTTTSPNFSCQHNQFLCNNGFCIHESERCDGVDDCGDNSDEFHCTTASHVCLYGQFQCNNHVCILEALVCNGKDDCLDNSDEMSCAPTPPPNCSYVQFQCARARGEHHCIPMAWVCDKEADCPHGDDELNCTGATTCGPTMYKCQNSEGCIPNYQVCNHKQDCIDGSDEQGCGVTFLPLLPDQSCPQHQFSCGYDDSDCLPYLFACDGHTQCVTLEDEAFPMCREANYYRVPLQWYSSLTSESVHLNWYSPDACRNVTCSYVPTIMQRNNMNIWSNHTTLNKNVFNFTKLQPATAYLLTVFVKVTLKDGTSRIYSPAEPVAVVTNDGIPDSPTHCHLYKTKSGSVLTTWKQPRIYSGRFKSYKIVITDVSSNILFLLTLSNTQNTTYKVRLNDYMKEGKNYSIKIRAVTEAGEGEPCCMYIVFDDGGVTTALKYINVSDVQADQINLSWPPLSKAKHYRVTYETIWKDEVQKTTENTSIIIAGLAPSLDYYFRVQGFNNISSGPPKEIGVKTKGVSISSPTNVKVVNVIPTNFNISWTHSPLVQNQCYIVYYDTVPNNLKPSRIKNARWNKITTQSYTVLKDLEACEAYMVRVAVIRNTHHVILPLSELSQLTLFQSYSDEKAQPKNLKVFSNASRSSCVNLVWESPCYENPIPLSYLVYVNDSNPVNPFTTKDVILKTTYCNLERGATYAFRVKTTVKNARFSEVSFWTVEPYSAPVDFKLIDYKDINYRLEWAMDSSDKVSKSDFTGFEIQFRKLGEKYRRYQVTNNTYIDLSNLASGYIYLFKVRLNKIKNYYGNFGHEIRVEKLIVKVLPITGMKSKINMVAIVVPICVVTVILGTILTVLIIRHRRLQRSFLAYASSHYDTRSQRTTITAGEDLGDEEDSPMIRGFSDDEPLVIA